MQGHHIGSISEAARRKEIIALVYLYFREEKKIYMLKAPSYMCVI